MELLNQTEATHDYDGIDLGEGRLTLPKHVTATKEGRPWFARGWFHTLNYNHEESVSCFARCLEVDPDCMMAYWGIGEDASRTSSEKTPIQ